MATEVRPVPGSRLDPASPAGDREEEEVGTGAMIGGEPCYLKFQDASAIKLVVAGGTAGKFSAVIGSWASGPRGSQMVTYPIED